MTTETVLGSHRWDGTRISAENNNTAPFLTGETRRNERYSIVKIQDSRLLGILWRGNESLKGCSAHSQEKSLRIPMRWRSSKLLKVIGLWLLSRTSLLHTALPLSLRLLSSAQGYID
jgi:hypothetical protein